MKLHTLEDIVKKFLLIPAIGALFVGCSGNVADTENSNGTEMMMADDMQPSDATITTNVMNTLMNDGSLSASAKKISVATNNGVVTLTGTVANKEEGRKVVRMVQNVNGVKSVNNQLTMPNY